MNSVTRTLMSFAYMVAVLSGQTSLGSGPSPQERQCLAEALPLLQNHAVSDAERELVECQRQHPESAILNNALGIVYEQQGRKADAAHSFENALTLLPSFTAAQIHLGTLYAEAGNCDPAKHLLHMAAEGTSDSGALVASGVGLAQCHDLSGSVQVLEKALRSDPSLPSAAYNLALAQYQSGNFEAALKVLDSLPSDRQANDPDVRFLRGKARQGIRQTSAGTERATDTETAALLSSACRLRPQEEYCTQAALELIHQQQFGAATELLENALQNAPQNAQPSVHMLSALGLARFRLGRYAAAIDAYSKALEGDPSLEAPREGLAFLLYMTGDLTRARSVVEAAIAHKGSESYLQYLRALILYRQSSALQKEALASVSAAIQGKPDFAPAYFLRGKIHSDQNDLASALQDFLLAIKSDPNYALPYYRMARIYSAMGRPSDAAEATRQFYLRGSSREDELLAAQATARLPTEPN